MITRPGFYRLPLLGAMLLSLAACQQGEQGKAGAAAMQMPPAGVDVVTVATQPLELSDTLPGRVSAYRVAEIRPQVSGIIRKRFFEEGAFVKAGDKLYQIDPALYQAALASAEAQLAVAEANAYSARVKAERYKALSKTSAISKQEVDDSEAASKQADAQIKAARAAVRSAEVNLGYTEITAPISGVISRSLYTEGALVSAQQSTALTIIRQISPVYVDVQSPAESFLQLKHSDAAKVLLELKNGSTMAEEGKLQFADVGVDEGTGMVNVRVLFQNEDRSLLPGMFVRARLVTETLDAAMLVPQQSVQRNPNGSTTVMLVNDANQVEARPVELGQAVGDKWLVRSGLNGGEKVILSGLQKAAPGATVNPNPVAMPGSGNNKAQ
ncbi:efflux RND transporter periplasmic adaptor subunit [Parathalassolituus penaei]|uniref:Efflux RND transporter periplasmic adaptor subunit n=1 Tax=Parathalassolituus penaei TaxID=2997323 RepID=A0A9X3IT61_9GAMM|nr:efflux RND transporter periplasmic adaptor subunit [Parathalassolituus penaei]MCY0967147.1 efflux RND transporter periplasmic adaptor subunit [Parathalassolituus penaei]